MTALLRDLAPFSPAAWAAIDAEARRSLRLFLGARKLVDFTGPLGQTEAAVGTGAVRDMSTEIQGVRARLRTAQALVELETGFELSRAEISDLDRGGEADLGPVVDAARLAAIAEDRLVFDGDGEAGVAGILQSRFHKALPLPEDLTRFISVAGRAVGMLRSAGVDGPYGAAVGHQTYKALLETIDEHGRPALEDLDRLLDGPIVWVQAIDAAAAVLSVRGGDFEIISGTDFAIGYESHTEASVKLYLEESLTFRCITPDAVVVIEPPGTRAGR